MSILYAVLSFFGCKQVKSKPENINMSDKSTFYQFLEANPNAKVKSIDGTEYDYAQLKGKKVLIVNTASECGYTPQYEDLEKLHQAYKDMAPIYKWPTSKDLNGWNDQQPKWNFNKYLLDEEGNLVKYYSSAVKPMSEEIVSQLK